MCNGKKVGAPCRWEQSPTSFLGTKLMQFKNLPGERDNDCIRSISEKRIWETSSLLPGGYDFLHEIIKTKHFVACFSNSKITQIFLCFSVSRRLKLSELGACLLTWLSWLPTLLEFMLPGLQASRHVTTFAAFLNTLRTYLLAGEGSLNPNVTTRKHSWIQARMKSRSW